MSAEGLSAITDIFYSYHVAFKNVSKEDKRQIKESEGQNFDEDLTYLKLDDI